jgi:hypothetical protein
MQSRPPATHSVWPNSHSPVSHERLEAGLDAVLLLAGQRCAGRALVDQRVAVVVGRVQTSGEPELGWPHSARPRCTPTDPGAHTPVAGAHSVPTSGSGSSSIVAVAVVVEAVAGLGAGHAGRRGAGDARAAGRAHQDAGLATHAERAVVAGVAEGRERLVGGVVAVVVEGVAPLGHRARRADALRPPAWQASTPN